MAKRRTGIGVTAMLTGLALTATACGSGGGGTGGGGSPTSSSSVTAEGKKGGTLQVQGAGDVDHLDTASAYYQVTYRLFRTMTRQLVSYPASMDDNINRKVVPDMAEKLPEPTNGGKTYTFTIKQGVQWGAPSGARQVTANDAILGLKRLCNPVEPSGGIGYYTGTIAGMEEFCNGFSKVGQTVDEIKNYINSNQISGVRAVNDRTVEINLKAPAGDFLNIMALPFASPAPVEYLDYLPDSPEFRQHTISDGPYQIESYTADQMINLKRNPAWDASTDDLRKGYVDRIEIREGSDEVPVQQGIEAGSIDMEWDTGVPTSDIPRLQAQNDPKLVLKPDGATNPYVVFNLDSPNAGGALKNPEVRKAINYAVNKQNVIQVLGGPTINDPLGQILTPPILGYEQFDPYSTPNSAGDPDKAKQMLAQAGYPNGLDLTFLYRQKGKAPQIATTLQADLAKAGVRLQLKPTQPADFYTKFLSNVEATSQGLWDLAAPGWGPDWYGNAARSFFVPLLDGRLYGPNTTNYGHYNNDQVNALIDKALSAQSEKEAADLWHQADVLVMSDAPWVPITTGKASSYYSNRVQNYQYLSLGNEGDMTNVWLQQ